MIFAKKNFFFVMSILVEIIRLAHSFGLWGCLGCSKHRQFHENHQLSMVFQGFDKDFAGSCHIFVQPPEKLLTQSEGLCSEPTYRFIVGPVAK